MESNETPIENGRLAVGHTNGVGAMDDADLPAISAITTITIIHKSRITECATETI